LIFLTGFVSESDISSDLSDSEGEMLQAALEQRLDESHVIDDECRASDVESSENEGALGNCGNSYDDLMSEDEEGSDEVGSDGEIEEGAESDEEKEADSAGDQRERGVSLFAANNDVERGKAAREQMSELVSLAIR